MKYNIAIVGGTGNVGREILSILSERKFPINKIHLLASEHSFGKKISFEKQDVTVELLNNFDFKNIDIAFFAAGSEISKQFSEKAIKAGAYIIDSSSFFRTRNDVPLIIPEVNPDHIEMARKSKIIAKPNCSTTQMLVPLKPLHDQYKIKRIVVSTYQAVSGKGKAAMDELYHQTKKMFEVSSVPPKEFTKQIAFNCIPHIDVFMENGYTKEEWKMIYETKKILDPEIEVSATCVRVAVFNSHSESVNVEFEKPFEMEDVIDILSEAESVELLDRPFDNMYATPAECNQTDSVFVSRLRRDNSVKNGLDMWIVADNLRKGAALNAVQIAELMIERKLI